MDLPKGKVLMKAFITSQFSYCPLIWMFHSRTLNNRINNIHERALRLTYKENQPSFKELLEKDHSVTVHHKNLQALVTDLAPDIMKDVVKRTPIHPTIRIKSLLHAEMLRLLIMVSHQLST